MAPVSVELCLSGADLTEVRLAPDGSSLAYVRSREGISELVVHEVAADGSIGLERVVAGGPAPRAGRGLGGGCWSWSPDATAIAYAAVDGNLWLVPLVDGSARVLTDHGPDRAAQAPAVAPDGRWVVYVVDQAEVWAVAVETGVTRRLDDGSADFCFDPCPGIDATTVRWVAWNVPDMPWDRARVMEASLAEPAAPPRVAIRGAGSIQQPRPRRDGTWSSVRDDTGWLNVWLESGPLCAEPVEHAGPSWGLGQCSYAWSPDGGRIAFTRNESGFGRLCVLEVATGVVTEVGRGVHGQLSWVGRRLAAVRSGARTPTQIVVYEESGDGPWQRRVIATGPDPRWLDQDLAEPELRTLPGGDGASIPARLYRAAPTGSAPRLICWIHGGPTDQWQVTFLARVAWWRSRGWDVLVLDHHGSTGHGRRFQQALRGRWGELDVADVRAALAHCHASGWWSPARTVLIGGSAGGFTVLGALRDHPELAAAAVVAYPVCDLDDLAERSHRFERHYTATLVGDASDPAFDPEVLRERSPIWFADRITTPLLVFHGEDDPVVPVAQSRLFVERMAAVDRVDHAHEVELVVYPGEGHGFRQRANQRDEYERTEAFLQRHVP